MPTRFNKNDLIGYNWAVDVVNGDFVSNKWVKLECQRYIDRIDNPPDGYFFDFEDVEFVYDMMGLINYATGFYANTPVIEHLAGFQAMIIENIFGWKDKINGRRMITDVTLLVGRKSGKSFLCALLEILLMLTANKFEQHALAGKTRDISALVKKETENLLKSSPIGKYFKLLRDKTVCTLNESYMRNLSGEANNINGLLLTSYIADEVGNMENHDILGALRLSQMSTKQRLAIHISTAYNLEVNAMRDLCDLHKRNLQGLAEDIHSFGLIFEIDEDDDYTDENCWIKASPLQMSLEDGRNFMRDEFKKGLEVPAKMAEFRIKLLNQWINSAGTETFISLEDFRKCKISNYNWSGKDVYLGLDLSQTTDNTSLAMVTYDYDLKKYVAKTWAFMPIDEVANKVKVEKVDYYSMEKQKFCFFCGDKVIDYGFIENFIINLEKKYGVRVLGVGYDRYNCISTANKLEMAGYDTIELKQHSSVLSPATKLLKESVLTGNFSYEMNTLLELNLSNAKESKDTNLNGYVNKKKSNGKVDMIVSLINAMALWNNELNENSIYNDEDYRENGIIII